MRWPEIVATTTAAAAASSAVAQAATAMIISSKYKLNTHTLQKREKRQQQLLHDVLFQTCMEKGREERLNFRNNRIKNRTIY